ncbi:MAG: YicC/YloC family endoribonuclease [Bacteroidales bacterium]
MIKSMTGFGKAVTQVGDKNLSVEIRTLNSKTLDLSLRLPLQYKDKEQELRNLLARSLVRGKAELSFSFENAITQQSLSLNKPLVAKYYSELMELAGELGAPVSADLLPSLLRLPEVLRQPTQEVDQEEWGLVLEAVIEALQQTDAFRVSEGDHMEADLKTRIKAIGELLSRIPAFEENRFKMLKDRLQKALGELKEGLQSDPNRFEQELIYYLEKLDISEEKVRLQKHLDYFNETMAEGQSQGKKLGFIGQEMGREINTIGSKANDADIQKIVVQMKDELEKIKEQLMNIL